MKSTFSSMDSEMGKIGAMISLSLIHTYTVTLVYSHTREMYIQRCCLSCQLLSQEDCFFLKLYLS